MGRHQKAVTTTNDFCPHSAAAASPAFTATVTRLGPLSSTNLAVHRACLGWHWGLGKFAYVCVLPRSVADQ